MSSEWKLVSEEERNKPNLPWKYALSNSSENCALLADELPDSENYTFASEALHHLMGFADIHYDDCRDDNLYLLLNDAEEIVATIEIDPKTEAMTARFKYRSHIYKKSADKL